MILSFFAVVLSMHLLGSAILGVITGGPSMLAGTPIIAFLGWFFIIPEIVGVWLQWKLLDAIKSSKEYWILMSASLLVGASFMAIAGPKEENREFLWSVAYACAGGAGAAWSLAGVRLLKARKTL